MEIPAYMHCYALYVPPVRTAQGMLLDTDLCLEECPAGVGFKIALPLLSLRGSVCAFFATLGGFPPGFNLFRVEEIRRRLCID
jgi:hypothetical protein